MPSTARPSIAIILTGGTIGSVLTDDATRADKAGNALLQSRMESLTKNRIFDFKFHQLLAKDSGDFDMPDWHAVASQVDTLIKQGCKRFLITHGTDTLPFTATVLQARSLRVVASRWRYPAPRAHIIYVVANHGTHTRPSASNSMWIHMVF